MILSSSGNTTKTAWTPAMGSFYDQSCKDLEGNDTNFSDYKGKVVLVTNVASK